MNTFAGFTQVTFLHAHDPFNHGALRFALLLVKTIWDFGLSLSLFMEFSEFLVVQEHQSCR